MGYTSISTTAEGMCERKKYNSNNRSIKTIWPHAVTHLLCLCMLYYLDRINDGTQNKCELAHRAVCAVCCLCARIREKKKNYFAQQVQFG